MHVLLLTDVPPCTEYTAGLVQKQLCEFLFEENISVSCISISDSSLSFNVPDKIKSQLQYYECFEKPLEGYGCRYLGEIQSFVFNGFHRQYTIPNLAKTIARKISDFSKPIDLIWSVIQGQTMIEIVPVIACNLKRPYVTQIWDPPEWWLNANKFDKYSYRKVMKDYEFLLRGSDCCLVASDNMAKEYNAKYGIRCVPVIPSLDGRKYTCTDTNENAFEIGFSGQIYAKKEFKIFLEALDALNWEFDGKKIRLHVFTNYIDDNITRARPGVIINKWVPQNKLLETLSGMDLCYCPYRFDDEFSIIARLSFPAKLTSYLSTGVPVFVHAPDYSSIANFIQDGISGYVCTSNANKDVINMIKRTIHDGNEVRRIIGERGKKLFLQRITCEIMKKDFLKALGIDKNENYTN